MKAVIYEEYGSPDELRLTEMEKPVPDDNQILIKVAAVSINGSDRENLVGKPLYARMSGLRKPSKKILGSDIAGRVESAGKNITDFKPGDEVFGELPGYHGGFAEYVCTSGETLAQKPAGLSFEEAAAIPQGGVIALRGIRNKGMIQPGDKVLINGAGGSAGVFAIQIAKMYGAEVTGVDNANKLHFMRSLGADHVIDYNETNFTTTGNQYDLILDLIAHNSVFACERTLRPGGAYLFVGGSVGKLFQTLLLGPILGKIKNKKIRLLAVPQNREDLIAVTELCEAGKIKPIIDRIYPLHQVPEAFRYIEQGLAKGKIVIDVTPTQDKNVQQD